MTTPSNAVPESPLRSQVAAPAIIPWTRRMYWSMRRELWEYPSIYVAPLAVAAVFLLGFLIALAVSPVHRHEPLDTPYGERRDRSILFWKSLPVSDLTTVLSKFAIPLIILPLLSFAIAVVT